MTLLGVSFAAVAGCSGGQESAAAAPQSGGLTPEQDAGAKTLGIATPNGVKQDAGGYTSSVNFAKSIVSTQRTREARESATVDAMSGKPH